MSHLSTHSNSNDKTPKHAEKLYKRKSARNSSFFFGPEQFHKDDYVPPSFFSDQTYKKMKSHGIGRTTHSYLKQNNPSLLKFIYIGGFPLFMLGFVIMFLIALVCIFFTGIYIMVRDLFKQFGPVASIVLLPAAIVVGGIGATLFPYVFKSYILEIHYEFWFEFAEVYFGELCSIRR